MRFRIALAPVFLLLSFCVSRPVTQSAGKFIDRVAGEELTIAFAEGTEAWLRGDFEKSAAAFDRAVSVNAGDEVAMYMAAAAHAGAGQADRSVELLQTLAAARSDLVPSEETFAKLADNPSYRDAVTAARENARRVTNSEIAFVIHEPDLLPEGIAYDPVSDSFFVGSLFRAKIIRISKVSGQWTPVDFKKSREDGLLSVLGMKVDPLRRHLWVASDGQPPLQPLGESERGEAALLQFDIDSGTLIAKHALPRSEAPHMLNDVDVAADGDVFVTDTAAGAVYRLARGGDQLEPYLKGGSVRDANGIAVSDDDSKLYVATLDSGIVVVDRASRSIARLMHPAGLSLTSPDGLYVHDKSLIAIHNAIGRGRIVRYFLDDTGNSVRRAEFLEASDPRVQLMTTAVVARDELYYIANAQFNLVDPAGQPLTAQLKDVIILKKRL